MSKEGHGAGTSAIHVLMDEHRLIERLLRVLRVCCDRLRIGRGLRPEVLTKAMDFIKVFSDRCHHGKEENILFPFLEGRGFSREVGPVAMMLMEHEEGRRLVKMLTDGVERYDRGIPGAKASIIENGRAYIELLTQHMFKEDNVLYPMAERALQEEDHAGLIERFEELEESRVGKGVHQKYVELLGGLEKELKISRG